MKMGNVRDEKSLQLVYTEICRAHHGIADFRAKLLALLPIASGTGIIFTLSSDKIIGEPRVAIGTFAALFVLGLYIYELRGIQRCVALSQYAREIEACLLGRFKEHGTFAAEHEATFLFANNTIAALVIYPTQVSAWVYLMLSGIEQLHSSTPWHTSAAATAAGLCGIVLLAAGFAQSRLSIKRLAKEHSKCEPLQIEEPTKSIT